MNTTRARRSFLCSRAALVRLFYGNRGLRGRFTLLRNIGRALDHERWSLTWPAAADQHSEEQHTYRYPRMLQ